MFDWEEVVGKVHSFLLATASCVGIVGGVSAQEQKCNPRDFVDFTMLNQATHLSIMAFDMLEESKKTDKSQNVNVSAIIKGVPAKLGWADAKTAVEMAKRITSYDYSLNQKSEYIHTGLTSIGLEGYRACLKQNAPFVVEIPSDAYRDRTFFVKISDWCRECKDGAGEVEIEGGTINEKTTYSFSVKGGEQHSFRVRRDLNEPMWLMVSINKNVVINRLTPHRPVVAVLGHQKVEFKVGSGPYPSLAPQEKVIKPCVYAQGPNSFFLTGPLHSRFVELVENKHPGAPADALQYSLATDNTAQQVCANIRSASAGANPPDGSPWWLLTGRLMVDELTLERGK